MDAQPRETQAATLLDQKLKLQRLEELLHYISTPQSDESVLESNKCNFVSKSSSTGGYSILADRKASQNEPIRYAEELARSIQAHFDDAKITEDFRICRDTFAEGMLPGFFWLCTSQLLEARKVLRSLMTIKRFYDDQVFAGLLFTHPLCKKHFASLLDDSAMGFLQSKVLVELVEWCYCFDFSEYVFDCYRGIVREKYNENFSTSRTEQLRIQLSELLPSLAGKFEGIKKRMEGHRRIGRMYIDRDWEFPQGNLPFSEEEISIMKVFVNKFLALRELANSQSDFQIQSK